MEKFIITYGMGGGFNSETTEVIDADSIVDANQYAYEAACQEYESFEGYYGIRSAQEIADEDGIEDQDEIQQVYEEEMEGWIEYSARPYTEGDENL